MTDRWEYMQIVWAYPGSGVDENYFILRPGKDSEVRDASDVSVIDVLGEFGSKGWELVGEIVLENTVMQREGWGGVGIPIRERWTLKRWIGD